MLFFLPSETVALNMMDTRNKSGQVTVNTMSMWLGKISVFGDGGGEHDVNSLNFCYRRQWWWEEKDLVGNSFDGSSLLHRLRCLPLLCCAAETKDWKKKCLEISTRQNFCESRPKRVIRCVGWICSKASVVKDVYDRQELTTNLGWDI